VLLVKLGHLQAWNVARRARAAGYVERFAGLSPVTPPVTDAANEHIFHQFTIRAERRDELLAHLKAEGIGCAVYYPVALHLQPCFADLGYARGSLPVTERAMEDVLSLPIYPELTDAQQDTVVNSIRRFYS
jgi:dTDP-4-amino-4,6-dideoxygalactose transaminase